MLLWAFHISPAAQIPPAGREEGGRGGGGGRHCIVGEAMFSVAVVLILQEGNSIQAELEAARWDWLGWVFLVALLGSVVLGGMSVIGPEWRRDRFALVLLGLFVTVGLLLAAHLAKGL